MQPISEKITDPIQSAFVFRHSIHDNILFTHEIMTKFKNMKAKKAWIALKLDVKKAYDRVEWDLLFSALHKLNFHSKWVELIKDCISTVSYTVIVNDNICGSFTPSRGVRQGNPLSAYIFILCMEVLTRTLRKALRRKECEIGTKILQELAKSHACFSQMIAFFFAELILNLVMSSVLYWVISVKFLVSSLIFTNHH